jgi:hypothetical protein
MTAFHYNFCFLFFWSDYRKAIPTALPSKPSFKENHGEINPLRSQLFEKSVHIEFLCDIRICEPGGGFCNPPVEFHTKGTVVKPIHYDLSPLQTQSVRRPAAIRCFCSSFCSYPPLKRVQCHKQLLIRRASRA